MIKFILSIFNTSRAVFISTLGLIILSNFLEGSFYLSLIPLLSKLSNNPDHNSLISRVLEINNYQLSIHSLIVIYMLFALMICSISHLQTVFSNRLQQQYVNNLSQRVFKSIFNQPYEEFIHTPRANYIQYLADETNKMSIGINYVLQLIGVIGLLIIQFGIAFMINSRLSLIIILISSIGIILISHLRKYAKQNGKALLLSRQKLHFNIEQLISSASEIKLYHKEEQVGQIYQQHQQQLNNTIIKANVFNSLLTNVNKFIAITTLCVILYISLNIFMLNLTSIILLVIIFMRIFPRINGINNIVINLYNILPSFNKLNSLIKPLNSNSTHQQCTFKNSIDFENVSYQIANKPILQNINLSIKHGTTSVICGETGAGKSTIINLLTGLLTPRAGIIKIDGINLQECSNSWQQQIAYVSPNCALFNATILHNLTFFNSYDEAQVWEVLEIVKLDNMIRGLADGLKTMIGDNGICLSNGERQRLVLARALLKAPQVLILDEATSMLDEQTEGIIHQALSILYAKITLIIVSHRIHTIQNIDQIITIDKGSLSNVKY